MNWNLAANKKKVFSSLITISKRLSRRHTLQLIVAAAAVVIFVALALELLEGRTHHPRNKASEALGSAQFIFPRHR